MVQIDNNITVTGTYSVNRMLCYLLVVSLAAIFWMSHNTPPKEGGRVLCDIRKTAARETNLLGAFDRVRTCHGKPGKSWNLRISFSRPGNSWDLIFSPLIKSWKITPDDKARIM